MINPSKYVVLDVETNGLSSQMDDLLSISLFLPDKNMKFERFLPLYLNKHLNKEACKVNGITEEMLKGKTHITQDEFDLIAKEYELFDREILHFGKIDKGFIKNYMNAHNIKGYSKLNFHDIKHHFITNSFSNGEYSKDNLCIGLGIEGVKAVHSGINDCILEWKLFEKIDGDFALCRRLGNYKIGIYKLSKDYYIPASSVRYYPNLKYAVSLPAVKATYEEVFRLDLSKKCKNEASDYFYQPAGYASEKIIWKALNARDVKDDTFARTNFAKMTKLGEFSVAPENVIEVTTNEDGTLTAVRDEDKAFVEAMNKQMVAIKKEIPPLIEFIKHNIFRDKEILTQEVIVNDDLKAFGYCDFSNEQASLEMKFGDQFYDEWSDEINEIKLSQHKYQYLITSNGRESYVLIGSYFTFRIYKVNFEIGENGKKRFITWHTGRTPQKVEMYTQDGTYVKTFNSYLEVMEELEIAKTTILDNCKGRVKLTKGYQFKFEGSDKIIGPVIIEHKYHGGGGNHGPRPTKHVLQYDLNGNFIKEFESVKEAQAATGAPASKISMVCNGSRNQSGGFKWKYKNENE